MGFPLDDHVHPGEPRLDELLQGEALLLDELGQQDVIDEVIRLRYQHSIQVSEHLCVEVVAIRLHGFHRTFDQVFAALNEQGFLGLENRIDSWCIFNFPQEDVWNAHN